MSVAGSDVTQFLSGAALGGLSVAAAVFAFISAIRPFLEGIGFMRPGSASENSLLQILAFVLNAALDLALAASAHYPLDLPTTLAILVFAGGQVAGQSVVHTSVKANVLGRMVPGFTVTPGSDYRGDDADAEPLSDEKMPAPASTSAAADAAAGS